MADIKDSVGEGGKNLTHEIAIVQLMLRVVKNAKGVPYLKQDYSGTYDTHTKEAIIAFQKDHKLIPAEAVKDVAAEKGAGAAKGAGTEKAGLINPTSLSYQKLAALMPAEYKDALIIEGTKTLYFPMKEASAKVSADKISKTFELDPIFRSTVSKLVIDMYAQHKIALSIPGDGWRRNFAAQANVNPAATGAGPGESNHQYGKAVDIGFQGIKWVNGSGQIKTDNFWLEGGGMPLAKRLEFWEARNKIAFTNLGLSKTNKEGDLIHVQAYPDKLVSYGRSLAAHLTKTSTKGMTWKVAAGSPNKYKTDLGLGGDSFLIGTANAIWAGKASISKADLAKALTAKLKADSKFSIDKFFNLPPAPPPVAAKEPIPGSKVGLPVTVKQSLVVKQSPLEIKEADIKAEYVTAMQKMLKAEFQAADAKWAAWKVVP